MKITITTPTPTDNTQSATDRLDALVDRNVRLWSAIEAETGLKPAYLEDILAWVLNNCDIKSPADTPAIFGNGTPAQRAFGELVAMYF